MSKLAAKYAVATRTTTEKEHKAGAFVERTFGNVSKLKIVKTDGRFGRSIYRDIDFKKFKLHVTHAAHDVEGLVHNGQEREGFRTQKAVKRSVTLAFEDMTTANKAFNEILKIDNDALAKLMESETLQDLLKEKLGITFAVPMRCMDEKPYRRPCISLFPPHFMAS